MLNQIKTINDDDQLYQIINAAEERLGELADQRRRAGLRSMQGEIDATIKKLEHVANGGYRQQVAAMARQTNNAPTPQAAPVVDLLPTPAQVKADVLKKVNYHFRGK